MLHTAAIGRCTAMSSPANISDDLPAAHVPAAARLLARSMRDSPLHQRVFGNDAASLEPLLHGGFERVLHQQRASGRALGAYQSRELMAVVGMFGPGHCLPNLRDKLALLPILVRARALRSLPRIQTWLRIWSQHDPAFEHWRLGPAATG